MLELDRFTPDASRNPAWDSTAQSALTVGLARNPEELEAIQRLRFQVFTEEMNAVFPEAANGVDADRFDPWCDHFMVREETTGRVVGTYRLLTPTNAVKAGGYYSESEFDLSGLGNLRHNLVELGRSCIHPDYRNGTVIMLLWSGIASVMRQHGFRHLLGCASVSLRDDGVTAAEVWRRASKALAANKDLPRVVPLHRYPVERLAHTLPARVPPLIKGYLNVGAQICGEPAWDPDFNTADFPVLLDIGTMDDRYRRHFGMS
ncbi:GNAT family N-acetyltransferase [Pusillimonas sp. TS35]|uniref:GNAT family N-acetyltransferase n=1 Tax=Paracandidimonas lactea TaxID=2895524 RepID=UPI00136B29A6|nr:GNAT family N-acyltransferase [Paracandidimonas lactea]MYN13262.1 GNAT family N-acetyltransferase [Pusillimonas sp. TS35]